MAKKKKKSGKKGFGVGFYITLAFLVIVPVGGIVGWYVLEVTKIDQAAEELMAKAQAAFEQEMAERANAEGFEVEDFDECKEVTKQFKTSLGYEMTEKRRRHLLGLAGNATAAQELERCIIFAKVVANMERLAHHDRHVFVCEGARFSADDDAYLLQPDPAGRGALEIDTGSERLIPIKQYRSILLEDWQVYNLGDGCLVIGMSRVSNFKYSGEVQVIEEKEE
jgi:hypothetical protein